VRLAYEAWGRTEGIEAGQVEAGVEFVVERLRKHFPETVDEMRGIAHGSGLPFEHIVLLNCLDAVVGHAKGSPSCSTIGFVESDAGVLLGKTADWEVAGSENFVSWQRYEPEEGMGHAFVHYGCAGTLWTEGGLNEIGLGMVLNGLPGLGASEDSVHWLCLTRGVLQHCENVEAALDFMARYDLMFWGVNLMVADAEGDLATIEILPGGQAVRRPDGDYLIHTNHCLCEETAALQGDTELPTAYELAGLGENSRARYETLERIVPDAPRTVAGMEGILRDRSTPGAISQYGEGGLRTICAMIVAPERGQIWGAEGFPPRVPFVDYRIGAG
jgi:hypothetical protein